MGLRTALALAALLASPVRAHQATGQWLTDLNLSPEADSVPAFSRLLREDAAAAMDAFRDRMLNAPPPAGAALQVRDATPFASPDYVSLWRSTWLDMGGAHPSLEIAAWTWDVSENRLAQLSDFVQGQTALERLAAHLRRQAEQTTHGGTPDAVWRDEIARAITPETLAALPFTLAPSTEPGKAAALDFHFGPYEIGPYSAGPQKLRAELPVFEPFMTDRARRLFGGAPAG